MRASSLPDPAELLPYSPPALQVDRVLLCEPGRLVAVKTISHRELDSHLGGSRSSGFPASLMLESFLQSCALVLGTELAGRLMLFGSAADVRVEGTAHAGDLLVHIVELTDRYADAVTFTGVSRVGDRVVLSVERVVMLLRPAASLVPGRPEPGASS
jgi:3-hydroxyacyl-[acyl-carrier-protein] dehydratase